MVSTKTENKPKKVTLGTTVCTRKSAECSNNVTGKKKELSLKFSIYINNRVKILSSINFLMGTS